MSWPPEPAAVLAGMSIIKSSKTKYTPSRCSSRFVLKKTFQLVVIESYMYICRSSDCAKRHFTQFKDPLLKKKAFAVGNRKRAIISKGSCNPSRASCTVWPVDCRITPCEHWQLLSSGLISFPTIIIVRPSLPPKSPCCFGVFKYWCG